MWVATLLPLELLPCMPVVMLIPKMALSFIHRLIALIQVQDDFRSEKRDVRNHDESMMEMLHADLQCTTMVSSGEMI